jgi:WD40 repeat protein
METETQAHDVFVSYAREDGEFVRRLTEALSARGKRSWVDWADIPPTAEWMNEIRVAIDAADTYLVVLSPASIGSKICAAELDHALTENKRIVPVLARPVDDDKVPPEVAKLHWISFTDGFDQAIDKLVEALDTDLDHVRAHTRLLVRAREWGVQGEEKSLLLRGQELRDAEVLIGSDAQPRSTLEQTRLVVASRRAATRRQRGAISLVTAAFVMSAALGVFGWTERDAAIGQRNHAEEQAAIAISRELSLGAVSGVGANLDRAILLAIQARRAAATSDAKDALHLVTQKSLNIRLMVPTEMGELVRLVYSPDGRTVASANIDGSVALWDARTGVLVRQSDPGPRATLDVAFNPEGSILASANGDRNITLLDVSSGTERTFSAQDHESVLSIEFSPDGRTLASGYDDGTVLVWDVAKGRLIGKPLTGGVGDSVFAVAFDPSGRTLAAAHFNGTVAMWDPANGRLLRELRASETHTVESIAFSPDGSILASTVPVAEEMILWDPATGQRIGRPLKGEGNTVWGASFSPDGRVIAAGSGTGDVLLWDVANGQRLGAPLTSDAGQVDAVAFSPDGHTLVSGGVDGALIFWEPLDRRIWRADYEYVGADFSPDGRLLAVPATDGSVTLWNSSTLEPISKPLGGQAFVNDVAFSPDGNALASSSDDGTIFIRDPMTGRQLHRPLNAREGIVLGLDFSRDGRLLASGYEDGKVILWDTSTWQPSGKPIKAHSQLVWSVAFSPDGRLLATGTEDSTLRLWDVATHVQIGKALNRDGQCVVGVVFSPDGRALASVGCDGVRLWSVPAGKRIGESFFVGHTNAVVSAAFSPDGKVLATAGLDQTVILWDLRTFQPIGSPLKGHNGPVYGLAFSPDGRVLASASLDGSVVLWPERAWGGDDESLIRTLCELVGRNLTRAEWEKFIPSEPYARTCAQWPAGAWGRSAIEQ